MPYRKKEVDLDLILNNISDGITVHDLDWRYVYANQRAAEIIGLPAEMILGKSIWEIYPELEHSDFAQLCESVKADQKRESTLVSNEYTGQRLQVDIYPSTDAITFITRDVTKSEEMHEVRLQFMARLSEKLASSLTDPDVLQSVAELATESFADYCSISEKADAGMMRSLAFSCSDETKVPIMRDLIHKYGLHSQQAALQVVRTGEPLFLPHISDEIIDASCPTEEYRQLAYAADLRSVITVPLESRGEIIGAITFALSTGKQFKQEDVDFARMLGRRVAAAVDNARLYNAALQEIEDRKRAEAEKFDLAMALETERERLSNILASIPGVVYETKAEPGSPDYRIVFVSDNMREWTGVSPDDLVRDPALWMSGIPESELPGIYAQAQAIAADQTFGVISFKMKLKDGKLHDVESHYRALVDASGKRTGRCGVLMDVTARKQVEEERAELQLELDRERLRLREIMGSIPGAVYETIGTPGSSDYKLAYISPYVEQMIGRKAEEIADDPLFWVHYSPKEYRDELLAQIRNLPPDTDTGSFSFKWQHKNGRIFDVEAHFKTRRDSDGNIAGRTGVVMDVTDRLRAEQELSERREQLSRLMSNIPGMAYRCLTEKGWPFEYVSSGCAEFTGYPAEDFLLSGERRWFDLINPEDIPQIDRIVEDCISRNVPIEVTYRIMHASGEERFVLDRAVTVKDDNDEIVAFEGICIDITEIKRAQDAIMQANQAKDQFIAALSHELRTPLTPVLTCVEILKDDERMPKDLQPMMEIIERNIQLESRLIDDLLDLTRIIRGKVHLEKRPMDLHSLLLNAVDICSGRIKEKQLELKLELTAKRTTINCDPARMQQVLWNLIQNAAKFTPNDGVITVKTWNSAQDELFISIQDTGIGMEEAQLSRIFNPFEQGTPTITKRYGGLGLGLAISQRIIDLHTGTINAFSAGEGKGSTFTIALPVTITESVISNKLASA